MGYRISELDTLKRLFERVREAADSGRNKDNITKWERVAGQMSPDGAFHVFLGNSYISRSLSADMREYYFDPALYLSVNLRQSLMAFEKFIDDAPLSKTIAWHMGVTMEPSYFGVRAVYENDKDAWEDRSNYLIEDYTDLDSMQPPDFYNSSAMRHIHEMYEKLCAITSEIAPDFTISFPRWKRSPFGVACSLRGMERLCMDFYDNPSFVHKLMEYITRSRMQWEDECNAFLGEKCGSCILANDEVNCPTVSPQLYAEFILPYEKQLIEYYGELGYFHSCGDLTPLLHYIKPLAPKLLQVSPWTDLEAACAAFAGTDTVLDIWAHVSDDVMYATGEHARQAMSQIYGICRTGGIAGFQINSGNIQQTPRGTEEDDIKIMQWADACRSAQGIHGMDN